jgi:hypothetical protein
MSSTTLTAMARQLAAEPNRKLGATRLLAAALLLRQALENALDGYWSRTVPEMVNVSGRAQLISLPFYVDPQLAGAVNFAWCRLSALCHHDAYELPPSLDELERLADIVESFERVGE